MNDSVQRFTCIVCPLGCPLEVRLSPGRADPQVTGNRCRRGLEYGRAEVTDPRRVLTTTVALTGAELRRLPVKTARPIPRDLLQPAAQALWQVTVAAPVRAGEVVAADLLGTGVAVVVTRDVAATAGGGQAQEENP